MKTILIYHNLIYDIIVPSCPIHVDHHTIVESSSAKSEEQLSNIETDQYILSPDGKEFIKAKNCESLIIPDSVEIVKAFACCGNIKNITIPHSVKVIEDFAFSGCSVNKIIIPNSVEKFGACIFSNACISSLFYRLDGNELKTVGVRTLMQPHYSDANGVMHSWGYPRFVRPTACGMYIEKKGGKSKKIIIK